MKCNVSIAMLFLLLVNNAAAKSKDPLLQCWNQQVKPLQGKYVMCSYEETLNELHHSFQPWQATRYTGRGDIYSNSRRFLKNDSIKTGSQTYYSKTQFDSTTLLFLDYGDKDLFAITPGLFTQQYFKSARYMPAMLINYFYRYNVTPSGESNRQYAAYTLTLDKTVVTLFIDKQTKLLNKVRTVSHDDLLGDVTNTFNYSAFTQADQLVYAKTILINKIGDKLKDTVNLLTTSLITDVPYLLTRPDGYTMKEDTAVAIPPVKVQQYSDHIHFVDLEHTNGKSMIVEFKDFLLVAEAPLKSENGELIISEARKIAPAKPIKYFVFGHYHPDYIGGMRPFIRNNAKVLCTKGDVPYIEFLAAAPHTLVPDSLQLFPRALQTEVFDSSKTITDGSYEMKIYFIGGKSAHTNDYLLYYFPAEKLLFEDDLTSIPANGTVRKAWKGQQGLYNAIKDLGLDVNTIVQSWPISKYGTKSEFPFSDLEASMNVK